MAKCANFIFFFLNLKRHIGSITQSIPSARCITCAFFIAVDSFIDCSFSQHTDQLRSHDDRGQSSTISKMHEPFGIGKMNFYNLLSAGPLKWVGKNFAPVQVEGTGHYFAWWLSFKKKKKKSAWLCQTNHLQRFTGVQSPTFCQGVFCHVTFPDAQKVFLYQYVWIWWGFSLFLSLVRFLQSVSPDRRTSTAAKMSLNSVESYHLRLIAVCKWKDLSPRLTFKFSFALDHSDTR